MSGEAGVQEIDRNKAVTYKFERLRAISSGILETSWGSLLLLIAVRFYEAGPTAKALISTGGSLGLLITPLVVAWVAQSRVPATRAAAFLSLLVTAGFLFAGSVVSLPWFIGGSMVAMVAAAAAIPIYTQVYQDNYPRNERGKLFSRTTVIRIAAAGLFSELAGRFLGFNMGWFPWLILFFAMSALGSAWCSLKTPSQPLSQEGGTHPFRAMRYLKEDRLLRWMLISWMFMGMGNLMMIPLRVEYLANPKHGLSMSVPMIALLVGVLPNVTRLIFSLIWGWLFDRVNFLLMRVVLNIGFLVGIFTFFVGDSMTGLVLGALIFGIAVSGGDVAWSLWVTKLAMPSRVADYMSLHTFFTGVRGMMAPFLAFYLLEGLSVHAISLISVGLILVGTAMVVIEMQRPGDFGEKAETLKF